MRLPEWFDCHAMFEVPGPINEHHPILCFSSRRKLPTKHCTVKRIITVGTRDGRRLFLRAAPGLKKLAILRFLEPASPSLLVKRCFRLCPTPPTLSFATRRPDVFKLENSRGMSCPRNRLPIVVRYRSFRLRKVSQDAAILQNVVHQAALEAAGQRPFPLQHIDMS